MKRLILLAVVLSVGCAVAGWRGRFDEQFAAASSRWTPAALGPIAWYKGDGNAKDAMGNYNGTWVGTEAYADGVAGQALSFTTNTRVAGGMSGDIYPVANSPMSVAMWFNASLITSAQADNRMFSILASASTSAFVFALGESNRLRFFNGGDFFVVPIIISTGNWYHVVASYDGAKTTVYIDNVAVGTVSNAMPAGASVHPVRIGHGIGSEHHFYGQIDDVLIFDRALTVEEVEKLYDESVLKNGEPW